MGIKRIGRHLLEHRWRVRKVFPKHVLASIERAIKASEATHSGQIRFVVEGALDGAPFCYSRIAESPCKGALSLARQLPFRLPIAPDLLDLALAGHVV